jgi:PAS domain S-box-containing protein
MQKKRSNLRYLVAVVAALAAISFFAWWTAKRADLQMRDDLLQQAKLVSAAADTEYVATLSGTEKDMAAPGFLQLKDRLARAREVNPKCRFLYLLGQRRDGTVFFFLDTEPADSENYSPPGQAYPEATELLRNAFASGKAAVEGPVADRWGAWVSALVPLRHEATGRVVAVLGMDMDARFWGWEVARRCALPVGLAAFVLFLVIFIIVLNRNHRLIRAQEQSIRESEQKLRNIIENSTNVFYAHTPDHVLTYLSPQSGSLLGYSQEEALVRWMELATDNPANKRGLEATQRAIDTGKAQPPFELELRHKNGKSVWVEAREGPVVENGRTVAIVGALTDISGRKIAEEFQAAALQEKGALLREFQHRVKNSLAIIAGIAELEANHSADPAVHKALGSLAGRIRTLSELYTLLHNSEQTSRVALDRYCESISDFVMAAHAVRDGRITLKRRLAPLITDAGHASTLGLILNELLTNALKYAFPGSRAGAITLSLTKEDEDLVLEIADDGVGLPSGFELQSAQGLGLQLVKMLANQLGGSLSYRSGEQTVFVIRAKKIGI